MNGPHFKLKTKIDFLVHTAYLIAHMANTAAASISTTAITIIIDVIVEDQPLPLCLKGQGAWVGDGVRLINKTGP